MRRLYRNPTITVEELIEMADGMGFHDAAGLFRVGGPLVDELVAEFNKALQEDEDTGPLTDKKAWTLMAKVATETGEAKGWPKELIEMVNARLMAEAAK